jgi:hypothetical protein
MPCQLGYACFERTRPFGIQKQAATKRQHLEEFMWT